MEGGPFQAAVEAEAVVAEVIDEIIDQGAAVLYDHYLESKTEAYAVSRAMDDMFSLVDWGKLKHETQEDVSRSNWTSEEEPVPPPIDTWARGAVPTRKRPKKPEAPAMPPPPEVPEMTLETAGGDEAAAPATNDLASTTDQLNIPARPLSPEDAVPVPSAPVDPAQHVRLKGLAQLRRDADAREKRKKAEKELLERRKAKDDRIIRDTRGRQFTYDANGDVIIVARPSEKNLSPEFLESGVTIDSGFPSTDGRRGGRRSSVGGGRKAKKRPPPDPNALFTSSLTRVPDNAFVPAGTTQPPLKETIRLKPGVRVKDESISLSHLRAEEAAAEHAEKQENEKQHQGVPPAKAGKAIDKQTPKPTLKKTEARKKAPAPASSSPSAQKPAVFPRKHPTALPPSPSKISKTKMAKQKHNALGLSTAPRDRTSAAPVHRNRGKPLAVSRGLFAASNQFPYSPVLDDVDTPPITDHEVTTADLVEGFQVDKPFLPPIHSLSSRSDDKRPISPLYPGDIPLSPTSSFALPQGSTANVRQAARASEWGVAAKRKQATGSMTITAKGRAFLEQR